MHPSADAVVKGATPAVSAQRSPGRSLVVAVASDAPVPGCSLPLLDLNDTDAIGHYILKRIGA